MTLQELIDAAAKHGCGADAEMEIDLGEGGESLNMEENVEFEKDVITISFVIW